MASSRKGLDRVPPLATHRARRLEPCGQPSGKAADAAPTGVAGWGGQRRSIAAGTTLGALEPRMRSVHPSESAGVPSSRGPRPESHARLPKSCVRQQVLPAISRLTCPPNSMHSTRSAGAKSTTICSASASQATMDRKQDSFPFSVCPPRPPKSSRAAHGRQGQEGMRQGQDLGELTELPLRCEQSAGRAQSRKDGGREVGSRVGRSVGGGIAGREAWFPRGRWWVLLPPPPTKWETSSFRGAMAGSAGVSQASEGVKRTE